MNPNDEDDDFDDYFPWEFDTYDYDEDSWLYQEEEPEDEGLIDEE